MAKLYGQNGEWKMPAIGENASGRTFYDLLPAIRPALDRDRGYISGFCMDSDCLEILMLAFCLKRGSSFISVC